MTSDIDMDMYKNKRILFSYAYNLCRNLYKNYLDGCIMQSVKEISYSNSYEILHYLLYNLTDYSHIKIVNRVKYSKYGILIKFNKNKIEIRYYRNQKECVSKGCILDILNRLLESKEEVYVCISYENNLYDYKYLICLEENVYEKEYNQVKLDSLKFNILVNLELNLKLNNLLFAIDNSLINGDKELFLKLTSEYNDLLVLNNDILKI